MPHKPNLKKKIKKERKFVVENKTFNSDNSLIPEERKISIDMSKYKIENKI